MTLMRRTETDPRAALLRALRLAGFACALTVLASAPLAHAQDDEEEDPQANMSFEQKMISNLMHGLGGQSMEDNSKGINYRERSPLVIPSKTDLPPPASKSSPKVANWPKDPDIQARRAAAEEAKQPGVNWDDAKRPLLPSELAARPSKKKSASLEDDRPGIDNSNYNLLSPSQLGFNGGMWSSMMGGKEKVDSKAFVSEPTRTSLTQPPAGYQTPSSQYEYGTGPIKSKTTESYNPTLDQGDRDSAK
jgi:hypothetical protein